MKFQMKKKVKVFQKKVISWYIKNGRDFFWRDSDLNLWNWILLEICLKRTKAETVDKYVPEVLDKYTNPQSVLETDKNSLILHFSALGLQKQRVCSLIKISNYLIENNNGKIPKTYPELVKIPYIGQYTANAVLCFALNIRRPILDVNTSRVISRVFNYELPSDLRNLNLQSFVYSLVPVSNVKKYNFGLLDIGSILCKPLPNHQECPLNQICCYLEKKATSS